MLLKCSCAAVLPVGIYPKRIYSVLKNVYAQIFRATLAGNLKQYKCSTMQS